jgi:hypothetical protein
MKDQKFNRKKQNCYSYQKNQVNMASTNKQQQEQKVDENSTNTNNERVWDDELENDYQRILSVGEECISGTELKSLLLKKGRGSNNNSNRIILYDGFEPSGRMHIAQGTCYTKVFNHLQFFILCIFWFVWIHISNHI